MAAGKQDSRQKMINMMYLVFIAMLALNISKEVLGTLGILNEEIENSIKSKEDSHKSKEYDDDFIERFKALEAKPTSQKMQPQEIEKNK